MSGVVLQAAAGGVHTPTDGLDMHAVRLLETRILYHTTAGWVARAYVWNREQTEAMLEIAGDAIPLELERTNGEREAFTYFVPDANQCKGCHVTNHASDAVLPIGPSARHLDKTYPYAAGVENQLARWHRAGYLDSAGEARPPRPHPDWRDTGAPLDARARAYLDINCAHCHSPVGPANTSALYLDASTTNIRSLGLCKPPIAAGRGTGNRRYSIVPGHPERSILSYRMRSTDPGEMMPEIGRTRVHREAVAMIDAWIGAMDGQCVNAR